MAQGRATTRAPRTIASARVGSKPLVTIALIVVNLAFFLVTAVQARSGMVLSNSAIYLRGGLIPAEVASGEYWRLLTAGFLHGNLIHLATNMLSLYWLGIPLERILGRGRMLTIYLLSLLGSSVGVLLFSAPVSLTIGASGAVYGLMGALLATFRRLNLNLRPLIVVLALNVFITFSVPGLSWQGHLGGFVVGAIVGAAMVFAPRASRTAWQWGVSIGLAIVLVAVTAIASRQIGTWQCFYQVAELVSCA
ncbi:MAG TPA: rhomboid family intramembrane serine protease, partial [Nakamurella sp.]